MAKFLITAGIILTFGFCFSQEYVSFPMMNMEIRHTLEEHERQVDMHENQMLNTATETVNKNTWEDVKNLKKTITKRLNIVSTALQSIPTGYKVLQDFEKIYNTQTAIFQELEDAPWLAANVLPEQIVFGDQLQMTARFMVGLIASYGTLNQMERAERQVLLNFALDEVKSLKSSSIMTLYKLQDIKAKMRMQNAMFDYQIQRDKDLVTDILSEIGL